MSQKFVGPVKSLKRIMGKKYPSTNSEALKVLSLLASHVLFKSFRYF
jgi:hypothetical protein